MAYLWRIVAVIGVLLVLAGVTLYAMLYRAVIPPPPENAEAAADRLLFDWKTGNLAIESAVAYGNEILPYLEEKTNGFERIGLMQTPRLAEVLSRIDTPECEKLLQSLYATGRYGMTGGDQRAPSSIELPRLSGWWEEEGTFQKCVGAFALARQGKENSTRPPSTMALLRIACRGDPLAERVTP